MINVTSSMTPKFSMSFGNVIFAWQQRIPADRFVVLHPKMSG